MNSHYPIEKTKYHLQRLLEKDYGKGHRERNTARESEREITIDG